MRLNLKENYIFYNRLSDKGKAYSIIWNNLYKSAMNDFNNITYMNFNHSDIKNHGQILINMGLQEQRKERNLINTIFNNSLNEDIELKDYPHFINTINELIGLKDKYKTFITKLDKVNKTKKNRAPVATSFFDSRLNTAITEITRNFILSNQSINLILEGNYVAWSQLFYSKFEKIIDKAVNDTANQIGILNEKDGDETKIWFEFAKLLENPTLKNQFMEDVRKRYNFDNIVQSIWNWQRNKKSHDNTKGLSTIIKKKGMNMNESAARSASGFIYEYLSAVLGETDYSKGAVLKSNIAKTDTIKLYSAEINLDLQPLIQSFNDNIAGSSLEETRSQISNFYNNTLSKLDKSFIVYESAKSYSLTGLDSRGFGNTGSFDELINIASQIGKREQIDNLLKAFRNTMNGAIGNNRREEVKEKIRFTLSEAIAYFLFDDWKQIGESNNNSIHIFSLDGVLVPLSYLLIAAGKAMQETEKNSNSFFKLSLTTPKEIKYSTPLTSEEVGENSIFHFWDIQREEALQNSKYSISFIKNFTKLISQLLKSMQ